MDDMERFVSDGIIASFADMLRTEPNAARQRALTRLLIEEENRFGAAEERLRMVERHLIEGAAHIAVQTRVVAEMRRKGRDCRVAESLLRTSHMVQRLFEDFRVLVREEANRGL